MGRISFLVIQQHCTHLNWLVAVPTANARTIGLKGDPCAALQARVFLREWFGGKIRLEQLPWGDSASVGATK